MVEQKLNLNQGTLLQSTLHALQSQLNTLGGDDMKQLDEQDLLQADEIQCEASSLVRKAKLMVDLACHKIAGGFKARNGRPSCLQGKQTDYLQSLDEVVTKMDEAFAKNRERLLAIIDRAYPEIDSAVAKIQDQLASVKD